MLGLFFECFTKKYFRFSGRASRNEFWSFQLFSILLSIFIVHLVMGISMDSCLLVGKIKGGPFIPPNIDLITPVVSWLAFIFIIILPNLSLAVRRIHDINRKGACYFLLFIPIVGFIFSLALMFERGTTGVNRFGEDPKELKQSLEKTPSFRLFLEALSKRFFNFWDRAHPSELISFFVGFFVLNTIINNPFMTLPKFNMIYLLATHAFWIPAVSVCARHLNLLNLSRLWLLVLFGTPLAIFYFIPSPFPFLTTLFFSGKTFQFYIFIALPLVFKLISLKSRNRILEN